MARRETSDIGGAERKAREAMERAEHEAGRMREDAADQGRHMVGSARDRIRTLFEQQSHRAADQLGGVAHALHQAAQQLEEENQGPAARYVDTAAERVERMADTLRDSSVDDLVGMVESYARRQPEIFLGAAFAAGFLFSRFVKSSGERRYGGGAPAAGRRTGYAGSYGSYAPAGAAGNAAHGPAGYAPTGTRPAYPATTRGATSAAAGRPAGATTANPAHVPDETLGPTPALGARPDNGTPQGIKP
ncbi:hypothetical protein [Azospirillum sp. ST 5-10]|uniref:hypothetical protein n=1 Tax=unclassified Azospirillum TaxID=2630922 RepID=UPI003F4A0FF8